MRLTSTILPALLLAVTCNTVIAAPPLRFTVTQLPGSLTFPLDINRGGDIAGEYLVGNPDRHGFLFRNGVMRDLGTLGGMHSYATALNNVGQVVGSSWSAAYPTSRAFLYDGGSMRDLGTPGGTFSHAYAINDAGQVVGSFGAGASGGDKAFLYSGGRVQGIATPGATSSANDINASGHVVGHFNNSAGQRRGFVYGDGVLRDIGTLGGSWATADSINDAGHIAGHSETASGEFQAFILRDGVMTAIPSELGGGDWSPVIEINNHDWIVGKGASPYFWADGVRKDLNRMLVPGGSWVLDSVTGFNDSGQIVAHGCTALECAAVRLDPTSAIPEPRTYTTLLAGLGILGAALRRHLSSIS